MLPITFTYPSFSLLIYLPPFSLLFSSTSSPIWHPEPTCSLLWHHTIYLFSWLLRINSANGLEIKSTGTESSLTVANVTEEHYGNYTCVAVNKLGVTNASLYLYSKYGSREGNTTKTSPCLCCTVSMLQSVLGVENINLSNLTETPVLTRNGVQLRHMFS